MSQGASGPAQGTRSRKTSGLPKALQKVDLQGQKLVSEYIQQSLIAEEFKQAENKAATTRQQMPNIYHSSIEITPKAATHSNMEENGVFDHDKERTCESANKGANTPTTNTLSTSNVNSSIDTQTVCSTTAITTTLPQYSFHNSAQQQLTHPLIKETATGTQPINEENLVGDNTNSMDGAKTTNDTIVAMLQSMSMQLTTIQNNVKILKDSKQDLSDQLDGLKYDVEDNHSLLITHHHNIGKCQDQVSLLSNIVCRYEDRIEELNSKVVSLEARMM